MKPFPYFKINGSAFERGKQHGQLAKEQIAHNLTIYELLFQEYAQIKWDQARELAAEYIPWIEKYDREIMEEIKGISEGSAVDLVDIVALNARSEIMLHSDGCTSFAAVAPATRHGETLLCQNWDWRHLIKPGLIVLEIEQAPRPTILMVTEAGIVGKIGMNSEGLGVCLNMLGTADHVKGVPVHVVLRGILNSKSLAQAVGQVARLPRGNASNFMVAQNIGEALDIEMSPLEYDVLYPEEGLIAHTNHFIGPRQVLITDTARINFADTHMRLGIINKLLAEKRGELDAQICKELLSNHVGYPDSICRHGSSEPPDLGRSSISDTVFSIVMNLSEGLMEVTDGNPCTQEYYQLSLKATKAQMSE